MSRPFTVADDADDRLGRVPVAAQPEGSGEDAQSGRIPGLVQAGIWLGYAAAATTAWNGVRLGSLAFGDLFLILAAVTLVVGDIRCPLPKLPPWVWGMVWAATAVGVANQFDPPTSAYLQSRALLANTAGIVPVQPPASTNLVVMVPLVVRVILVAFVFALARSHDSRAVFRAAMAFAFGVCVSALLAFTDSRGLTAIGPRITGVAVVGARASGLTQQANVVAFTCVLALPLIVWRLAANHGIRRVVSVIGLFAVLLGLYASRSRAGAGAAGIAGITALIWLPNYRRHLATIALLLGIIGAVAFVADPGLGTAVLHGLRLTGNDTSGSDLARSLVDDQAKRDFFHSPIYGIGFEVALQAHIVYLQALAVGGVILLTGLVLFQIGALTRGARLANVDPLAIPLFVSVLGGAIFNAEQNALTPTIAYLTAGFVAALPLRVRALADPTQASNASSEASTVAGGMLTSSSTPAFGPAGSVGPAATR